ncbi:hypothetical protein GCM10018785_70830 [Streptomyces longispororuber]|uniref:Uncharacterized protein n=1 Tax=Streptomyces longispororuber TaxID=68230 RepID=A0A919ABL0_9ACTN|nr:hypothetical protein [Streptomyces longispororuber]GHE95479.1 hypothetical protein GCM10018785_70830 [Streptomyces longispororuber]
MSDDAHDGTDGHTGGTGGGDRGGGTGGSGTGNRTGNGAGTGAGTGGTTVTINAINGGSQAFGEHGTAESTNYTTVVARPEYADLLTAVRRLRRDLAGGVRAADDEDLDAGLAAVEGEITRTGRSGPGPVARVRAHLAAYAPAATTAASVTAVLQALAQLPQLPG